MAQNGARETSISGAFTGKESDETIASSIAERRKWFMRQTHTLRRQWMLNAAFARGQQFSILHPTQDKLIYLQEPPGRKQVQVDVVGPWKEHMIANFTRAMPRFEAVPETMDSADVSGARMGNALLDYYWENWQFADDYITITNYILDFGNAFAYLNYKEDGTRFRSRPIIDETTGEIAQDDETGEPLMERTAIGDVYARILPPQNVMVPLDGMDFQEKPWVAIQQRRHLDYFSATYGKKGEKVKSERVDSEDNYNLDRISNTKSQYNEHGDMNYANEIVYFQPPSATNEDGMIAVVANGILLERSEWPYQELTSFPIVHFKMKQQSGEFFGRSWVERQIPLQRMYNLVWSIIAENIDDTVHLKTLIPNQSGIDTVHDVPEIMYYNYPYAPTYLEPGSLPNYVVNIIQLLEAKIRDVQNFHGASAGTSVSGVRSDVHAQNLQEQDLLPLTVVDEMMRISFENMGEKILAIAAEKLTEDRIITFTGEDNQMMIRNFRGAMLGNTRTVKVRMENQYMRSKASTVNNIMQMYQIGGIKDQYGQPDSAKLMRMLEFAIPNSAFADLRKHTEMAYEENDKIMRQEEALVLPWQDHQAHLSVHTDFANSREFMDLLEGRNEPTNQRRIAAFLMHMEQHSNMYAQSIAGLAPAGASAGGEPRQGAGQQKQARNRSAENTEATGEPR